MTKKVNDNKIIEERIKGCKLLYTGDLFNFIEETKLRNALEKSYKEAVFIKNIIKELNINYSDAHPLNEIVILHFASIYEAIIDYIFESYFNESLKEIHKEAKKKKRKIRFKDKITKAIELEILTSNIGEKILKLYEFRNNIHILRSVKKEEKFTKMKNNELCNNELLVEFCNNIAAKTI
jgi:hypothetical protein